MDYATKAHAVLAEARWYNEIYWREEAIKLLHEVVTLLDTHPEPFVRPGFASPAEKAIHEDEAPWGDDDDVDDDVLFQPPSVYGKGRKQKENHAQREFQRAKAARAAAEKRETDVFRHRQQESQYRGIEKVAPQEAGPATVIFDKDLKRWIIGAALND